MQYATVFVFSLIWLLLFTVTCLFSLNNNTIFSPQPQGQTHRFLHHLVEDVKQVSSEATAYNDTNIKLRTYRYQVLIHCSHHIYKCMESWKVTKCFLSSCSSIFYYFIILLHITLYLLCRLRSLIQNIVNKSVMIYICKFNYVKSSKGVSLSPAATLKLYVCVGINSLEGKGIN